MKNILMSLYLFISIVLLSSCNPSLPKDIAPPPSIPTLNSISITPVSLTIQQGSTQSYTATGIYSDGTSTDITTSVIWNTSNASVATINISGIATGLTGGSTTITASVNSVTSDSSTLNVAALTAINVIPASTTVTELLTAQFTATAIYSDASSRDISSSVSWNTNNTVVATINSSGLASTLQPGGPVTITASDIQSGISGNASLNVTAAVLTSISVTPGTASVINSNQQFTATGTYNNGVSSDISGSVVWNSSNTGVASINAAGLTTVVASGATTITATDSITSTVSNNATLNVTIPTTISAPFPYTGTIAGNARNYYILSGLASGTPYTIVMDGMTTNQDITGYSDSAFTTVSCNSAAFSTNIETCAITTDASGLAYIKVSDISGVGGNFTIKVSGNNSFVFNDGDGIPELTVAPTLSATSISTGKRIDVTLSWDTDLAVGTGYVTLSICPTNSTTSCPINVSRTVASTGPGVITLPTPLSGSGLTYQLVIDLASSVSAYNSKTYTRYAQPINIPRYYKYNVVSNYTSFSYNTSIPIQTVTLTTLSLRSPSPVSPTCGSGVQVTSSNMAFLPYGFMIFSIGPLNTCTFQWTTPAPNTVFWVYMSLNSNLSLATYSNNTFMVPTCSLASGGICEVTSDGSNNTFISVRNSSFTSSASFVLGLQ